MSRTKRLLVAAAVVTAAFAGTTVPASATPLGDCNGAVDTGCRYCGHYSGNGNAYPYSYCYNYPGYYRFQTCYGWVLGHCYVG